MSTTTCSGRIAQLEARSEDLQRRCAEFAKRDRAADVRRAEQMQAANRALFMGYLHQNWKAE